jgi:hypothetical protein
MAYIQDIATIPTPTITGIMATVITRVMALITVTEIMAAIEAGILLIGGVMDMAAILLMGRIMDMAAIGEGTETAGAMGLVAVIAAAIRVASIDKNADIFI